MDKIKSRENCAVSVHDNQVNNVRFADDIDIIEQSVTWSLEKSQKRMMLK